MKNIYMEYSVSKRSEAHLPLGTIEELFIITKATLTKNAYENKHALNLYMEKIKNNKKYNFGILGEEIFTPFLEETGIKSESVKNTLDSIVGGATTLNELEQKYVTAHVHPDNYVKAISVPRR